jgi:hypothetical protein
VLRQRKPRLIEIAERASIEGQALIEPAVVYRAVPVAALTPRTIVPIRRSISRSVDSATRSDTSIAGDAWPRLE